MRTTSLSTASMLLALMGAAHAGTPDPTVEKQLKSMDVHYDVDDDGDYKVIFETGKDGARSQVVFVRSPVESYGSLRVRELWSPGYRASGEAFPASVANRLLESSQDQKLGGWVKQGEYAVFVVKIDAGASAQQLRDAMEAASEVADEIEAELTPGKDDL